MPIIPPGGETPIGYTATDLIQDALIEIGVQAPGEPLDVDEGQWAFRKLNYLLDVWEALRSKVYTYNFQIFTLVPGLQPHTIGPGPGATFPQSQRPVRIESSALLLNTPGTLVDLPMNIRDKDWWALNQVKQIQTNVPTDLYYDPAWPNGNLFLWPVPNTNFQVRIQTWGIVSQFALITDPIGGPGGPNTLPPAYRAAIMLSLAETMLPGSEKQAHPILVKTALEARIAVGLGNNKAPRISSRDSGMPTSGRSKPDFNWATGGRPGGPPQ